MTYNPPGPAAPQPISWQPQQPAGKKKPSKALIALACCLALGVIGVVGGALSPTPKPAETAETVTTEAPTTEAPTTELAPETTEPPTTEAPEPTTTTAPPPPPTTVPEIPTWDEGTLEVGKDIPPGLYRGNVDQSDGCYWERLANFDGDLDGILANDNVSGPTVVEIFAGDKGFTSHGCGSWSPILGAVTTDGVPLGDGTFLVGLDVKPGTYKSTDECYWERMANFSGDIDGIAANDNSTGPAIVTISASDKGFKSHGCGTWSRIG